MKKELTILIILSFLILSCHSQKQAPREIVFTIESLTDEQYPDNPDIGFRSEEYQQEYFTKGAIRCTDKAFVYTVQFATTSGDTLIFSELDLAEFIPTIPTRIMDDEYLSQIACINQEWNRNQVRFQKHEFYSTDDHIARVDVARNCLNSYLWEVIVYVDEGEKQVPYAHGWFDFPHDLYAQLFEEKNGITFERYRSAMEEWHEPASQKINFQKLRTVAEEVPVTYTDSSASMYPLAGARKKKFKEIIAPTTFTSMKDLQSNETLFATFTPPGFYNRQDPRTTELGRFYHLSSIKLREVKSQINEEHLKEVVLTFQDRAANKETVLTIGGLDFSAFPVLPSSEANRGWKSSMGIGNHSFYESWSQHNAIKAAQNPYYAMLTDEQQKWLDSHKIGIDGPIFYFSDEERTELHLWLLSFERHALVGHYVMKIG